METIRLFGLPRTGTNAWRKTMQGNYKCSVVEGDNRTEVWKHGCYCRHDERPILVTVRHPLSFLWATWKVAGPTQTRQRFNKCRNFTDFLFYKTIKTRENPVLHEWSLWGGYWLWQRSRKPHRVTIRRWEALLENPEQAANDVAAFFDLEADGSFNLVHNQVGPHKTRRGGYKLIRKQEIEEKKYLEHYTDETLEFVCDRIDPAVVDALGYEIP